MRASEYVDIGQYMRDSRESLRITIEQAAGALHIRPKYLRAIESGVLTDLPGKAYIRGYIKNYADYLRLNPDEVLEAYESLLAHKGQEFFVPEPTLRQNLPSKNVLIWTLASLVLMYGYWYFGMHDSSPANIAVAAIPSKFMQLLDKTPRVGMDTAWKHCLDEEDVQCFIVLRAQTNIPRIIHIYDNYIEYTSPQKP